MKKLKFICLIGFFLSLLFYFFPNKSYAVDYLEYYFKSNNRANIIWQVGFRIVGNTDANNTDNWDYGPTWKELVDGTSNCPNGGNRCTFAWVSAHVDDLVRSFNPSNYRPRRGVQWGTACVDPVPALLPGGGSELWPGADSWSIGTVNITYNDAAVDYFENNGGGTLYFGGFRNTNNCPKLYSIDGHVFIDKNRDGNWDPNGNPNEPAYQGAIIRKTGDGNPEPDTTGNNGYYRFYNLPSGGNYKVEFTNKPNGYVFTKPTDGTWTGIDLPPNHTVVNGNPFNFGIAPAQTKDLIVSAFTYPGGTAGTTTTPTISIKNTGNTQITGNFVVRVCNGNGDCRRHPVGQTVSANETINLSGASEFQNMPLPSPAGTYTANATVDVNNDIPENNETNNDRTDAYTTTSRDLIVSAFTYQSGVLNSSGTNDPTIRIQNIGTTTITNPNGFVVRVCNGNGDCRRHTVTQAVSPQEVIDLSNSSDFANMPRPPAGNYTANATVDVNNDIPENNETNNDRTDAYTTTSNIGGTIFIDDNPTNGTRDPGEALYTSSINIRVGDVNYTGIVGTYKSGELDAGTYNVTMPTVPPNYILTTPTTLPVQRTLGPNRTVDFGLKLSQSTIIIDVFEDFDGNGAFDATAGNQDKVYPGATITVTGQGSAGSPYTTNASGRVTLNNLNPGNSNITLTVPGSYTLSTPKPPAPDNAITITVPPTGQTVNFGIQPPAPYCAGGLTANPSSVTPGSGVTSALTCVSPTSPNGDPLSYNWPVPDVGSVDNVNLPTSTWRSPISTAATSANPSVQICYQGTNRCGSSTTPITLIQRFTITGQVYIDENENKIKDAGESNYTGNITITATPVNGSSSTDVNGAYTISNLPASSYTISYTNLPANYRISYPQGPPPSFNVTVGSQANCTASIAGYNSAQCTNGSISNLNFGIITNAGPWIQSGGSDIWFNNGLTNPIPSGASCQSYASLANPGGTPGIVYSGIGSADFGSGQASANPYNWKVGGISSYSESYGPASSGSPLATSYSYIKNLATTNGTPPVSLTSPTNYCGVGNGLGNCTLSSSIPSGVYEATGSLTLTTANYTFPVGKDYVILVNGNLRISGKIHTPPTSTVLFSVKGDINVSSNVGNANETFYPTGVGDADLEGWFSTDHSFYVESASTCPARDNRLNVAGAIIVNASLEGGSFYNQRDLCSQNSNCPVFYIKERPDFSLNAPRFIKNAPRVYKEVAP